MQSQALWEHCSGQSPAWQSPAKIPAGECEITPAGLGMESKVRSSLALWGQYWAQSKALKPHYPQGLWLQMTDALSFHNQKG